MRQKVCALLLGALWVACRDPAPLPSVTLHVVSDLTAPEFGLSARERRAPLVSLLEVATFLEGETSPCAGCSRVFSVSEHDLRQGELSFGIPTNERKLRLRVRLYRDARFGAPRTRSTVERVLELSPSSESRTLYVALPMQAMGTSEGTLSSPLPERLWSAAPSALAAAKDTERVPCGRRVEGSVCVKGGSFWMGDTDALFEDERIVVLSPFLMDAHEVTAADYLRSGGQVDTPEEASTPSDYCTAQKEGHGDYPINCVTRDNAQAYCERRGGALPTEAQMEFAVTSSSGEVYPWGGDPPSCSYGVFGRLHGEQPFACTALDASRYPAGPAAVHRDRDGELDEVTTGEGRIFDLAGNLEEWVVDEPNERTGVCWRAPLLRDPRCTSPRSDHIVGSRGGSYTSNAPASMPLLALNQGAYTIGFRCVYPGN